ncbi:MAG TPA: UDP-3-O-(3-hydroxymyristoyl)glucosamine N-acyltransferase [Gemmatimonadaceae bacterium]|nr:UDP-3-O-(3-hydroxymyristoyl)glucosamine N-acyltransferase [Gemmatimonadaceae bacterium]
MTAHAAPPGTDGAPALTAAEIAAILGGTLAGEGSHRVRSVAPLDRAASDQLSFLADRRYAAMAAASHAGVVLLAPEFADVESPASARVVVAKPYDALVTLLPRLYAPPARPKGVHPTAHIARSAVLGDDVSIEAYAIVGPEVRVGNRAWIGPHCVVDEGVSIGDDTRLVSSVTCYSRTSIGARCIVHAGVRLGSDGFGYAFAKGAHNKIPHVGRCVIGDDVEIGANTCVDRGSIDDTIVGAGSKIDNLVHLAHNVHIGRLCLIMAQAGIAGSSHVEDGAIVAGQVGVAGHLTIGAGARLGAQAGVISDVPPGETWSGYPARPHKEAMRASAALLKLSGMIRRIERLLGKGE